MRTVRQGTNEKRLHVLDFSDQLEDGDYITSVTWTIDAGVTTASEDYDAGSVEIVAYGGTANTSYTFQAVATTHDARKYEKTFELLVIDR